MKILNIIQWLLVASFLAPGSGSAEILHGIFPLDSLVDIKNKFPNGKFTRQTPAWLQENQAMFRMVGDGFPGALILVFDDPRPYSKRALENRCKDKAESGVQAAVCDGHRQMVAYSDDEALSISWVRWIPEKPIPFERYRSKYGEPTRVEFDRNSMVPEAEWDKVGLQAELSDDMKFVRFVTTQFTRGEIRAAYLKRFNFVPDDYKDAAVDPPARSRPQSRPKKQLP